MKLGAIETLGAQEGNDVLGTKEGVDFKNKVQVGVECWKWVKATDEASYRYWIFADPNQLLRHKISSADTIVLVIMNIYWKKKRKYY